MTIINSWFADEIFAEVAIPKNKKSNKVIILCSGAPSVPSKKIAMEFWCKKGYWVIFPRYRGTWESKGEFLKKSPHEDIIDVIEQLPSGFQDLWSKNRYSIFPKKIILMGSSFGGPAILLASNDPRISKVIAFSPVVTWEDSAFGKEEPNQQWFEYMKDAYQMVYRCPKNNWDKLSSGNFYNPMYSYKDIDGSKIMIIHAKDDEVCKIKPVEKFAKKIKAKLAVLKKGGHMGVSDSLIPVNFKKISEFIK